MLNGSVRVQLGSHPLFQRLASLRNARVFSKGKEVADDLRERWETSDSPLVHRIQVRTCLACPAPHLTSMPDIAGRQAGRVAGHAHAYPITLSSASTPFMKEMPEQVLCKPVLYRGAAQVALVVQDMTENMTVETETAKTYREMRARDPAFDMIKFLRALKQDVQPVIQARTQPERLSSIYCHAATLSAFG